MRKCTIMLAGLALVGLQSQASARDLHIQAVESDYANRAAMGVTTAVNLRIPLGGPVAEDKDNLRYDLTVAYGGTIDSPSKPMEMPDVRSVELAQINFDGRGARGMEVANYNISDFGRKDIEGPKKNLIGGMVLYSLLAVGVGVLVVTAVSSGDDEPDAT